MSAHRTPHFFLADAGELLFDITESEKQNEREYEKELEGQNKKRYPER
jgi:hypothetical protein